MLLTWHPYSYYEYEKELALREVFALLQPRSVVATAEGLEVIDPRHPDAAQRLAYFDGWRNKSSGDTTQKRLEQSASLSNKRQATRYSSHGLHEYKGKFNPQVAKGLLNIFGAGAGQSVLDPFCGSGTSLVEAALLGLRALGTDLNPLAVFVANAKLSALAAPAEAVLEHGLNAVQKFDTVNIASSPSDRARYLQSWFAPDIFLQVEKLKQCLTMTPTPYREILLCLASNQLRDHSLQEPGDLRIRRRTTPAPTMTLLESFEKALRAFCKKLAASQLVSGLVEIQAGAQLIDSRTLFRDGLPEFSGFDMALTSPPYATALPYIDTQRLSLVWLDMLSPVQVKELEADLVGSREASTKHKSALLLAMENNTFAIPDAEHTYCMTLQGALGSTDGFRRVVVPRLLYRYFSHMSDCFKAIRKVMKPGAPFGLIVGGNHTVLGGNRFEINTPRHLASIAMAAGWSCDEVLGLQTYQRFGLHASNATETEALVLLRSN